MKQIDKIKEYLTTERLDSWIYKLLLLLCLASCLSEPLCRNLVRVIFTLAALRIWQKPAALRELGLYKRLAVIMGGFILMLLAGAAYSGHFLRELFRPSLWYCYNMLLVFIVCLCVRQKQQLYWLAGLLVASMVILDGFIFTDVAQHWKLFIRGGYRPSLWKRTYPMVTAVLYMVILPAAITWAIHYKGIWRKKALLIAASILSVGALLVTGTRGAVISFFIVLGLEILYYYRKRPAIIAVFLLLIFAGGYMAAHTDSGYIKRMQRVGVTADNSQHQRLYMWRGSARIFIDHPLTGIGLGNFNEEYLKYMEKGAIQFWHPHSNYFYFLTGTGIGGLVLYCLLFGYIGWWGWKKRQSAWGIAVLAATLAFSIYSTNDLTFDAWQGLRVYWLLLGLCIRGIELEAIEGEAT